MSTTKNDLTYVQKALSRAQSNKSIPAIYFLWGCIVFAGFVLVDINVSWVTPFWLVAAPLGMAASAWLGYRYSQQLGQQDRENAAQQMKHYGIMMIFIFTAIFSKEYQSILLLIGLSYSLAGIHLERAMLWLGLLSLALYIAIQFDIIASSSILGALFAFGFFITSWSLYSSNKNDLRANNTTQSE